MDPLKRFGGLFSSRNRDNSVGRSASATDLSKFISEEFNNYTSEPAPDVNKPLPPDPLQSEASAGSLESEIYGEQPLLVNLGTSPTKPAPKAAPNMSQSSQPSKPKLETSHSTTALPRSKSDFSFGDFLGPKKKGKSDRQDSLTNPSFVNLPNPFRSKSKDVAKTVEDTQDSFTDPVTQKLASSLKLDEDVDPTHITEAEKTKIREALKMKPLAAASEAEISRVDDFTGVAEDTESITPHSSLTTPASEPIEEKTVCTCSLEPELPIKAASSARVHQLMMELPDAAYNRVKSSSSIEQIQDILDTEGLGRDISEALGLFELTQRERLALLRHKRGDKAANEAAAASILAVYEHRNIRTKDSTCKVHRFDNQKSGLKQHPDVMAFAEPPPGVSEELMTPPRREAHLSTIPGSLSELAGNFGGSLDAGEEITDKK